MDGAVVGEDEAHVAHLAAWPPAGTRHGEAGVGALVVVARKNGGTSAHTLLHRERLDTLRGSREGARRGAPHLARRACAR